MHNRRNTRNFSKFNFIHTVSYLPCFRRYPALARDRRSLFPRRVRSFSRCRRLLPVYTTNGYMYTLRTFPLFFLRFHLSVSYHNRSPMKFDATLQATLIPSLVVYVLTVRTRYQLLRAKDTIVESPLCAAVGLFSIFSIFTGAI